MKLEEAEWQSDTEMRRLLDALGSREGETRFVGGCVRDTLLGLDVSDVDLATRLQPKAVLERLGSDGIKAIPTGIAHGTVTAIIEGRPVEITTLRRDLTTDGRRATVAFTDDWREDAARRDFTINALSADPETLHVFDYFGGEADLAERRVRFIGDPLIRIAEDHLRILRLFRFHARFGAGEPDPEALDACTRRANDLMALSRERIADEILKLLALPDPAPTVRLMVERGILKPVLPEIGTDGVDALSRLIDREREAKFEPDPLRRFAALLPAAPELVGSVAARLRLSNKSAKRLACAAGRTEEATDAPEALAYRLGKAEAIDLILLGTGEARAARSLDQWERPRFPLGGGELIAMGLRPGPIVAVTLQAVEREWIGRGFPSGTEEVRAIARAHVDQALRDNQ